MQPGNTRTVYVVQVDNNKDLSDAKRYGQLRAVFGKPRKPYDTAGMVARARRILADWVSGDYLLMIGDPTLCAVCMTVASENNDVINVLSWDRDTFQYLAQQWDFGQLGVEYDDFATADD
jgi:hypothetical protein